MLSVWTHILAAAVWIGGMAFLALVLVPATRRPEYRGVAASLVRWTGARFCWVGWACLGLLLLSGTFNLAYRGVSWADVASGQLWQGAFGGALGLKLLLVGAILVLSALHDFVVGPRATALWQASPASAEALRLRRQAGWMGRLNLLLALAVVALGVTLVRGLP
ncbi:MAG: DUF4149 domain-containing protein [Chloroflexi bacterium]|nr:DUF4149 domain-containing protein [Chloroflexota bacterium]